MQKALFYCGTPGDGYGWGVCNKYLIRELSKLCDLRVIRGDEVRGHMHPLFVPIADHDLNPAVPLVNKYTIGYCFFEYPLGPKAVENANHYDLIFCGSTWCKERLAERGITHTEVLVQGVDHDIFFSDAEFVARGGGISRVTSAKRRSEFWLFSGGKFEYRKGQDIVLAAFKLLQDKLPGLKLLAAWENLWPGLCESMVQSPYLKWEWDIGGSFNDMVWHLCYVNGIDAGRIGLIPARTDPKTLAAHMHSTDLGVFPNRCEGGTNLVLMEYLACGKPAIASWGTGHRDIEGYSKISGTVTADGWMEIEPEELAESIEHHYNVRIKADDSPMAKWTWERAARQILAAIQ